MLKSHIFSNLNAPFFKFILKGTFILTLLLVLSTCEKEAEVPVELATVTTGVITNISVFNAKVSSTIEFDGGSEIIGRGVCWNTTGEPTIANDKTNDGAGIGDYTSSLTGLVPNTIYYVRAYSTNSLGTAYGEAIQFTTYTGIPILTTTLITVFIPDSATSGGTITDDGGSSITERGVCWNTTGEPTLVDSKTVDGGGLGSFSSSITGLEPNTTYYVRAYATNSYTTSYGNEDELSMCVYDMEGEYTMTGIRSA